jgi:hypothetical protein
MQAFPMATQIETLRVLKILGDIFPSFPLSSSAIEVYVRLLEDIPGLVLEQAALDHISRSTFFPSIAELRPAAFSIIQAIDPIPSEYEAWSEVQAEISRVGQGDRPQFKNSLVAKAVEQLGWRYLCLSENQVADRAHFIQAYQLLAERKRHSIRRLQIVTEFIDGLKATAQAKLTSGEKEVG